MDSYVFETFGTQTLTQKLMKTLSRNDKTLGVLECRKTLLTHSPSNDEGLGICYSASYAVIAIAI